MKTADIQHHTFYTSLAYLLFKIPSVRFKCQWRSKSCKLEYKASQTNIHGISTKNNCRIITFNWSTTEGPLKKEQHHVFHGRSLEINTASSDPTTAFTIPADLREGQPIGGRDSVIDNSIRE